MKFLMVNSPIYRDPQEEYDEVLPPIGLGYICTNLRKNGVDVKLLDSKTRKLNEIGIKGSNSFIPYDLNLDNLNQSDIFFVGLSHKSNNSGFVLEAFSDSTNTGGLIAEIEESLLTSNPTSKIYKTNLAKGVPLDSNGKIRYPNSLEKKDGLDLLIREIDALKPKIVYLFGKEVSNFVIKNLSVEKISDNEYLYGGILFIIDLHPSYILMYRRKEKNNYIDRIVSKINSVCN